MHDPTIEPVAAPPHPFRSAPWYDPAVGHYPCRCPTCTTRRTGGRWAMPARVTLVLLGGVVLPLASLLVNASMKVVDLGALGTGAIILAMVSTLANLLLSPCRRDKETGQVVHRPPASTALRAALLMGALLSCLIWGYLGLLFLPLLPLSMMLVAMLGLGLCGLCPYAASSVAVIQAVRGTRALRRRLRLGWTLALVLGTLLLPPAILGGVGINRYYSRLQVDHQLERIAAARPFSAERLRLVAGMAGMEQTLVRRYVTTSDQQQRARIAEVYLRLTDQRLNQQVAAHWQGRRHTAISPWWFLEAEQSFMSRDIWRF